MARTPEARVQVRADGAGALRRAGERAGADRLDLQIEVPALASEELLADSPSEAVRARVLEARAHQRERGALNAMLSNAALRRHCVLDPGGMRLVAEAIDAGEPHASRRGAAVPRE